MKLISLNIWGGRVHEPLLNFLEKHNDVDVFCFQELYSNAPHTHIMATPAPDLDIYHTIEKHLPGYVGYFRPHLKAFYGLGIFVKKGIEVIGEGDILIYENPEYDGKGGNHDRNLQYIKLKIAEEVVTVANVHGAWIFGSNKKDLPKRIEQSNRIKGFMNNVSGKKVLVGDFNLDHDTESLRILEQEMSMRSLIREQNITSTRSNLYREFATGTLYADYAFVSPETEVVKFEVLQDVVSDHLPLLLEVK